MRADKKVSARVLTISHTVFISILITFFKLNFQLIFVHLLVSACFRSDLMTLCCYIVGWECGCCLYELPDN